jgi:hypothetical protein
MSLTGYLNPKEKIRIYTENDFIYWYFLFIFCKKGIWEKH